MDFSQRIIQESLVGFALHKVICDSEGNPVDYEFMDANAAYENFTGLKREAIKGKKVTRVLPDIRESDFDWIRIFGDVGLGKGTSEFIQEFKPFGKFYKIKAYSPEFGYFIVNLFDVTQEMLRLEEMERLQSSLKEANIRYKMIADYAYDWETWEDNQGRLLYVSPACERISGYKVEEFLSQPGLFLSLIHEEDKYIWESHQKEKGCFIPGVGLEFRIRTKAGAIVWIEHNCQPVYEQNGEYLGYRSNNRDISLRKESEEKLLENELQFHKIIEKLPVGISINALDGTVLYANQRAISMYDADRSVIGVKAAPSMWKNPEDRKQWVKLIQREGYAPENEIQAVTAKKRDIWIMLAGILIQYQDRPCILTTHSDITDRKKMELALEESRYRLEKSEEKYRIITEHVSDVIWVLNMTQGRFTYISPSIRELRGFTQEEAMAQSLEESLTRESMDVVQKAVTKGMGEFLNNPQEGRTYITQIQQPCKDGSLVWVEVATKYRFNEDGEIEVLGVSRNIEERKKAEERILYLSYHDQLTGLGNRASYEETMERFREETRHPVSLMIADVNGLKMTNDSFGHAAGDRLLVCVAKVLAKHAREEDVLARIGGDEFVILMPETPYEKGEKILEAIRGDLEKETRDSMIVSVSFGLATQYGPEQNLEDIFKEAEDLMYHAKVQESQKMRNESVELIFKALQNRVPSENEHSRQVERLAERFGEVMEFSPEDLRRLVEAARYHDIGKAGIAPGVLEKAGRLSEEDWLQVRRHPEVGYQILKSSLRHSEIAELILHHHERFDGEGYPGTFGGSQIPLISRMLSIVDAYVAMTVTRTYLPLLSPGEAVGELRNHAGTQFDPELLEIFISLIEKDMEQK